MAKVKQASLLTPVQQQLMELINQGLTSGQGPFGELFGNFNKEAFEEGVTKPNMKMFEEDILPRITEKFVANNQVGGSGMQRARLKAGTDFQSKLAELMYQAQQGQQQNKLAGIQTLLGKQGVENIVKPSGQKSSIWSNILPAVGTAAGSFLGPAGTALGNVFGNAASKIIAG